MTDVSPAEELLHYRERTWQSNTGLKLEDSSKVLDVDLQGCNSGCVSQGQLSSLLSILTTQVRTSLNLPVMDVVESSSALKCPICGLNWADPVTTKCGHTFCRACLEVNLNSEETLACVKCHMVIDRDYLAKCKTSILLSEVLQKCFPEETFVNQLKVTGNKLLLKKDYSEAVIKYTEALKIVPADVHLLYVRSFAYHELHLYLEALSDANAMIQLRPTWIQGYYRKAVALQSLSRLDESFQCYIYCLAIEPGSSSAKKELTKIFDELFSEPMLNLENQGPKYRLQLGSSEVGTLQSLYAKRTSGSSLECLSHILRDDPGDSLLPQSKKSSASFKFSAREKFVNQSPLCSGSVVPCETSSTSEIIPLSLAESVDERKHLESLSAEDFECSLCSSVFLRPITTSCGHVFCCDCLYRSLDYRIDCPLCKESLAMFLAERRQTTTESIEWLIETFFPKELEDRKALKKQELSLWSKNPAGDQLEIPVFVCTLAYPGVICPLHVFEPRYRLMIRRCIESDLNQFGMCICLDEHEGNFAEFGTLLCIQNIEYFADGRSLMDTVGIRRFRVLSRSSLDGHQTATVTYLVDDVVPSDDIDELNQLQLEVHSKLFQWFTSLPEYMKSQVVKCYGTFPQPQFNYADLPDGPSWVWYVTGILPVQPKRQLEILSMVSLKRRLLALRHIHFCVSSIGSAS